MVPYIHIPDPGVIHPFGILVATGVLIGIWLATKRARSLHYDLDRLNSFITWMLVCGFIGGHMLDEIFYHPPPAWKTFATSRDAMYAYADFILTLPKLWQSLSSFGGFAGALAGILLWKYYYFESKFPGHPWIGWIGRIHRRDTVQPILPFADLILSVFPVAWVFGRSGCSSVHDHPGALASNGAFLAVEFPRGFSPDTSPEYVAAHFTGPRSSFGPIELLHGDQPRYDLGLLEMLFTLVLASLLALTWSRKVRVGTYVVVTALAYAPVRFAMDYLRITVSEGQGADPRYGSLTPAQWCCIALFGFGLAMIAVMMRHKQQGFDPGTLVVLGSASGERKPAVVSEPESETESDSEADSDSETESDSDSEPEPKKT